MTTRTLPKIYRRYCNRPKRYLSFITKCIVASVYYCVRTISVRWYSYWFFIGCFSKLYLDYLLSESTRFRATRIYDFVPGQIYHCADTDRRQMSVVSYRKPRKTPADAGKIEKQELPGSGNIRQRFGTGSVRSVNLKNRRKTATGLDKAVKKKTAERKKKKNVV